MKSRTVILFSLVVASNALVSGGVAAQQLADPMRPPMTGPVHSAIAADSRAGLQTILISGARRIAIIDGESVSVGSRVRGAEVVAISETEVILRGGPGRQVLRLLPDDGKQGHISRRDVKPASSAPADPRADMQKDTPR